MGTTLKIDFLAGLLREHGFESDSIRNALEELEMLKVALDSSSIVAFTDRAGAITHVNDNFCEISGYSRAELLGQNHRILGSGQHPREFFRELWRTISSGKVWRGEIRNRRKDGTLYWVDSTIVPFSKPGPYGSAYVAIRNDITERKLLDEKVAAEHARVLHAEKLASLGELTAGIAHELGNPIASIQGRAELLQMHALKNSPELQAQALKTVESILSLTARMGGILRSMTSLAREGSKDPFTLQALLPLLQNTLDFGAEKFRKREISVSLGPVAPGLSLECRDTQVIQILVNLLNNAADAVQALPERWIRLEAKEAGGSLEISVTDSGKGIPEALRARIFEPFFTTKAAGKGTGLGLHISHSLAAQNGGALTLDTSSPNTKFVLTLPCRQPRPAPTGSTESG